MVSLKRFQEQLPLPVCVRRRERKPASWEREIKRFVGGGSSSAGGQKSESWRSTGPWSSWTGRRDGKGVVGRSPSWWPGEAG